MSAEFIDEVDLDCSEKADEVYDLIRCIRDPEKEASLEQLCVVRAEHVSVRPFAPSQQTSVEDRVYLVQVGVTPTVSHCSLATLIGLCVRVRLEQNLYFSHKLDVRLTPGSHDSPDEVNKQINDKERVAAAMENPSLRERVLECITDPQ